MIDVDGGRIESQDGRDEVEYPRAWQMNSRLLDSGIRAKLSRLLDLPQ